MSVVARYARMPSEKMHKGGEMPKTKPLKGPNPEKLLKVGKLWVTGAWRHHPRRVRIDKVDDYDLSVTFIDDDEPKQTCTFGRSAFLKTFIPYVEPE
jgi:hypothetical protein